MRKFLLSILAGFCLVATTPASADSWNYTIQYSSRNAQISLQQSFGGYGHHRYHSHHLTPHRGWNQPRCYWCDSDTRYVPQYAPPILPRGHTTPDYHLHQHYHYHQTNGCPLVYDHRSMTMKPYCGEY